MAPSSCPLRVQPRICAAGPGQGAELGQEPGGETARPQGAPARGGAWELSGLGEGTPRPRRLCACVPRGCHASRCGDTRPRWAGSALAQRPTGGSRQTRRQPWPETAIFIQERGWGRSRSPRSPAGDPLQRRLAAGPEVARVRGARGRRARGRRGAGAGAGAAVRRSCPGRTRPPPPAPGTAPRGWRAARARSESCSGLPAARTGPRTAPRTTTGRPRSPAAFLELEEHREA